MEQFYCDDFYYAVSIDGLAVGLFKAADDADTLFKAKCAEDADAIVALWRLNGGYLCSPAIKLRAPQTQSS